MTIWAILPAAGIGRRLGSTIPKQYLRLNGIPVIEHSLNRLAQFEFIKQITVVLNSDDGHWKEVGKSTFAGDRVVTVAGGEERNHSVLNGLYSLNAQPDDWVLIHDAVRPCITTIDIQRLINEVTSDGSERAGGILATPMANTVKESSIDQKIVRTVDRSKLWNALTPQMFRYDPLLKAMETCARENVAITDEASAMEHVGHEIKLVKGSSHNIKITHASDLTLASMILQSQDAGL